MKTDIPDGSAAVLLSGAKDPERAGPPGSRGADGLVRLGLRAGGPRPQAGRAIALEGSLCAVTGVA